MSGCEGTGFPRVFMQMPGTRQRAAGKPEEWLGYRAFEGIEYGLQGDTATAATT